MTAAVFELFPFSPARAQQINLERLQGYWGQLNPPGEPVRFISVERDRLEANGLSFVAGPAVVMRSSGDYGSDIKVMGAGSFACFYKYVQFVDEFQWVFRGGSEACPQTAFFKRVPDDPPATPRPRVDALVVSPPPGPSGPATKVDSASSDVPDVKAVEPYPNDDDKLLNSPERLVQKYAAILENDGSNPIALTARGRANNMLGKIDLGFADCDKALKIEPSARAFNCRGYSYKKQGRFDLAIKDFDSAIANDKTFMPAYRNKIGILKEKKQTAEVITVAHAALSARPPDDDTEYLLLERGKAFEALNDTSRALTDYNAALFLNPNSLNALLYRGNLNGYSKNKDLPSAINDYRRYLQLSDNLSVRRAIVELLENANRLDEAKAEATKSISLFPKEARLYYIRGYVHYRQLSFDEAIADFDMAIVYDPKSYRSYSYRGFSIVAKCGCFGRTKASDSQLAQALLDFDKAIQLGEEAGFAFEGKGRAFELLGRLDNAARAYRASLKANPERKYSQERLTSLAKEGY